MMCKIANHQRPCVLARKKENYENATRSQIFEGHTCKINSVQRKSVELIFLPSAPFPHLPAPLSV